ncbi:major facilitator superfamily domain-containing protein [Mycena sp. CBHHK59/15]|nr:major facilitator superfamily domain-containing protein [Mycena sp. CBHHK59/15]
MLDPSKARRHSPESLARNIDGWRTYTRLDGSEYYARDVEPVLANTPGECFPALCAVVVDELRLRATVDDILSTLDVTFEEITFVQKDQWMIILHSSQTAFYSNQRFVDIQTRRKLYWQYIANHPSHTAGSLAKWFPEAHSSALVYLRWCSSEALASSAAKIPFPLKQSQDLTKILTSLCEQSEWTHGFGGPYPLEEEQKLLRGELLDVEDDLADASSSASEDMRLAKGGSGDSSWSMEQRRDDTSGKEDRDFNDASLGHSLQYPEMADDERHKLHTALIAKVLTEKYKQQGAVYNSGNSDQPPQPSVALDVLFWVVDVWTFGSFLRYLRRLEKVRATILSDDEWRGHISRLVREWEKFNLISAVLLSASVGMLAVKKIGGVSRTSLLISILFSFASVTTGLYCISMYQLRAPDSRDSLQRTSALTIFNYNQYTLTHKGIALILGLPMAFLVWSLVSFVVGILSFDVAGTETHGAAYAVVSVAAIVFMLIGIASYSLSRLWQAGRPATFFKNIWRMHENVVPFARPQPQTKDFQKAEKELAPFEPKYPTGDRLVLLTCALAVSVFFAALDNTIIATVVPKITDQFNSLGDVGWYGSAYLLASASFQLLWGRFYTFLSVKWVYIAAIGIFELGSLICAVAPTSAALIVGRAIAGAGSAGIFSGALVVVAHSAPLEKRPMFTGLIGTMYAVASIVGPLMGGALADRITWRWCFFLNLPVGGIALFVMIFAFNVPHQDKGEAMDFKQRLKQFDPIGTILFILLLSACSWLSNWGIDLSLEERAYYRVARPIWYPHTGILCVQVWKQDSATIPPRILKTRSIWSGSWFAFFLGATFFVFVYYLPIWFQAIKGVDATQSAIDNLPMILSRLISAFSTGIATARIGYYKPFMVLSTVFIAYRARPWIGYQVILGLGYGAGMNQSVMAAQTVLDKKDVATGMALIIFLQTMGGALFVSVAQNVFENKLVSGLAHDVVGVDPTIVLRVGATNLKDAIPPQLVDAVVLVYNKALVDVFYVATGTACLSVVGALAIEGKSIKVPKINAVASVRKPYV